MPRLCISCLRQFSINELRRHLLSDRSHIYSLEALKAERELIEQKLADASARRVRTGNSRRDADAAAEEERVLFMLKVVFAVKEASLIRLMGARRG